ncbi:Monooxygenase FAD-binding, partial [Penicillium cataractarum]
MSAMGNPKPKVIIVGGSIAGLTLAHCLSRAGIDHIVLEKRTEIAPQEGAFIGVWPNGAHVLQQLGLYESLEALTAPVNRMHISYPDGFSFSSLLPRGIQERLNYPIVSLDRKKVLEILYEHYPDKSKIITNKKVLEVQLSSEEATVVTDGGQKYHGSLIVGADGVHSRIRSEMWRLADTMSPGLITPKEKTPHIMAATSILGLTIEYACVFGISLPIPGLRSGEHINRYGDKFCVITFHGKGDRVFWFIIQKLDRVYAYPNAPRFSPKDAASLCAKLSDVKLLGDITVGDLWKARQVASMTALEEGMFETWHFNRIVLLGDSTHKMAPNIGQGANTAIEDVAVLSSLLNHVIKNCEGQNPSNHAIEKMLQEYQRLRFGRVKNTCSRAKFGARFHTRDNWLKAWIGRYIFPRLDRLAESQASNALTGGGTVDFLPIPERSKLLSRGSHVRKPTQRLWAMIWALCIAVFLFFPFTRHFLLFS